MNKIVAGFFWSTRMHRKEYIIAHFPFKMFVPCKWCGNTVSKMMYLIKQESDIDALEEKYSALCPCNCKGKLNV